MCVHMLHWKGPLRRHPNFISTASPLCSPGVALSPHSTRATYNAPPKASRVLLVTWHFWKSEAILRRVDKTCVGFSQLSWKSYLLRWSFYLCSGSAARWGCSAQIPLATAAREAKPSQCCRLQQQHSTKALLLCSSSNELHLGRYGWFLWQTAASNMYIWAMVTIIILKVKMWLVKLCWDSFPNGLALPPKTQESFLEEYLWTEQHLQVMIFLGCC